MTMKAILFLVWTMVNGGVAVERIEFPDVESCEAEAKKLSGVGWTNRYADRVFCVRVPKRNNP